MTKPINYYRCYRCAAPPSGLEFRSTDSEAKVRCPHCGAAYPAVLKLTPVHFIFEDKRGPLTGQYGIRWRVACMPQREMLNGLPASDLPIPVTCLECRRSKAFLAALEKFGIPHDDAGGLRLFGEGGGITVVGPGGCCG